MTRSAMPAAFVALAVLVGPSACAVQRAAEPADAGADSEAGASTGGEATGGAGGETTGAGGDSSSSAGAGATGSEGIWSPSSTAIDVGWREYFGANMRYRKTRAELTDEELTLIEAIRQDPRDTGCVSDGSWASLTVTTNGVDTSYRARIADALCGETEGYVGYDAVWALLQAAGCETHFQAAATLENAPSIRADSGCYFAFQGAAAARDWWALVEVAEPRAHKFFFENCEDVAPTTAALFDEEGVAELAGTTALPGECPNLTVDIPAAGTYALHVASVTPAPNATSFSLHIERAD